LKQFDEEMQVIKARFSRPSCLEYEGQCMIPHNRLNESCGSQPCGSQDDCLQELELEDQEALCCNETYSQIVCKEEEMNTQDYKNELKCLKGEIEKLKTDLKSKDQTIEELREKLEEAEFVRNLEN
jgi:hypothetical protein